MYDCFFTFISIIFKIDYKFLSSPKNAFIFKIIMYNIMDNTPIKKISRKNIYRKTVFIRSLE